MKSEAYDRMAKSEVEHWYYVSRSLAIETLIRRYVLPVCHRPEILDVGCGTGGTSARLANWGSVVGLEPSPVAIKSLQNRYPSLEVVQGTIEDLPSRIAHTRFDLVTILGVLYHRGVPDPRAALERLAAQIQDGGWILWGDCVYPCLSRPHDELVEAGRRFYPAQMHDMLRTTGFEIVHSSHFLGWGFPIAFTMATLHRLAKMMGWTRAEQVRRSADDRPLPGMLNGALTRLTYWEWRIGLWGPKAPVGVSRLVLARRKPNQNPTRSEQKWTAANGDPKQVTKQVARVS